MTKPNLEKAEFIVAMVTPMHRDGQIEPEYIPPTVNYTGTERLARHLVDTVGVDGLVVCGTTGESATLTAEEEYMVFGIVKDAVGDRALVIAGTGSNNTAEAVERTRNAKAIGVDATLQVEPYYNRPSQEGMIKHFTAVANVGLPVMLYNIPKRTGVNLDSGSIIKLSLHPNIYAIKECNLGQVPEYAGRTADDFLLYSGDDGELFRYLELGAKGVVSVAGHLEKVGKDIKRAIRMYHGHQHLTGIRDAHTLLDSYSRLFAVLFSEPSPAPIKAAVDMTTELDVGGLRLPMTEMTKEGRKNLHNCLNSYGIATPHYLSG